MKSLKPFVKWVGGKTQILSKIDEQIKLSITSKTEKYIEAFVGGGAVLFHVIENYKFKKIVINDSNAFLINTYYVIKNNIKDLIIQLKILEEEYIKSDEECRKFLYYKIRDNFNKNSLNKNNDIEKARDFIFLNKTCFNGLFRVNSKGLFNTPQGRYKNPLICDEENLKNVSKALENVTILCDDYTVCSSFVDNKSLVYLDPPYRPITKTANFTSYNKEQFDDAEQIRLSNFIKLIENKGAKFILSNSDPKNYDKNDDFFDIIYRDFHIDRVEARRSINSNGSARGKINELLINN